jgi:hypothetical protein
MRIHSVAVLVFSCMGLFACAGASQETAAEKDVWAGYKGTYATPGQAKSKSADKGDETDAKHSSQAKSEPKEDVADTSTPDTASEPEAAPSSEPAPSAAAPAKKAKKGKKSKR